MSKRRREPSEYGNVQSSDDEFYMDYHDKPDNYTDISYDEIKKFGARNVSSVLIEKKSKMRVQISL